MTTNRSLATPAARLCRPSRLHCRSGASSLLRLSQPSVPRLPTPLDLTDWVSRAAGAFERSVAAGAI